MRKKQQIHRYAQFTLVELLVVIAILLILISLLQPHLRSVIGKGRQIACNKTEQVQPQYDQGDSGRHPRDL